MCVVITGVDGFNIAAIGCTSTTRPSLTVANPVGDCIHAFAVTTNHALATPPIATGHPAAQCAHGESRSHPNR